MWLIADLFDSATDLDLRQIKRYFKGGYLREMPGLPHLHALQLCEVQVSDEGLE